MDVLSVIGLIGAAGLLVFGMSSGSNMVQLRNFWDAASIAITVGGTFASLMIMFPLKVFANLPKMLLKIFGPQEYNPQDYIADVVEIAYDARRNGVLFLEEKIPQYRDEFMRKGVQLIVDSAEPEDLRDIMETELGFMIERHKTGVLFFEKGAILAPGFGLLGTLAGLINMLASMENPAAITSCMAVALITTFYGTILANVVFLPMGNKLKKRSDEEVLCKQIIIEGMILIENGENPKQIQEKLLSYIPPSMRKLNKSLSVAGWRNIKSVNEERNEELED